MWKKSCKTSHRISTSFNKIHIENIEVFFFHRITEFWIHWHLQLAIFYPCLIYLPFNSFFLHSIDNLSHIYQLSLDRCNFMCLNFAMQWIHFLESWWNILKSMTLLENFSLFPENSSQIHWIIEYTRNMYLLCDIYSCDTKSCCCCCKAALDKSTTVFNSSTVKRDIYVELLNCIYGRRLYKVEI